MRKNILITAIIGVITGILWAWVFSRLGTLNALFERFKLSDYTVWGLVIVVPAIFIFGLYLGLWLSRWKYFFISFSRFVIVGFMNAGVDFGVFNFLMFLTKIEIGIMVSVFKAVSFVASFTNSYFWNKYWSFESGDTEDGGREFAKFTIITIGGLIINVGGASAVIFLMEPQFGFSQLEWNNIAAVVGAAGGLLWNFIGYRFVVFKQQ